MSSAAASIAATEVFWFRWENVSLAAITTLTSSTPAASARSSPRPLSTSPTRVTSSRSTSAGNPPPRTPATTASASAICGTSLGCTKLATSIRRTPAARARRTNSTFTSVGSSTDSFCRPSRGSDLDDLDRRPRDRQGHGAPPAPGRRGARRGTPRPGRRTPPGSAAWPCRDPRRGTAGTRAAGPCHEALRRSARPPPASPGGRSRPGRRAAGCGSVSTENSGDRSRSRSASVSGFPTRRYIMAITGRQYSGTDAEQREQVRRDRRCRRRSGTRPG